MTFTDFYNKSKIVLNKANIISTVVQSMDSNDIISKNQTQLIKGTKANGEAMPDYKPLTLQIKQEEGGFISPSGKIALANTFDFFNAFNVVKTKESAKVSSKDSKRAMLEDRYGVDIFGLTEDNEQKIITESEPKYIAKIKKDLGL